MEFVAGSAFGGLLFFLAFWVALGFIQSRQVKQNKEAVTKEALPFVVKNDEIEARIEKHALDPEGQMRFPTSIGRMD